MKYIIGGFFLFINILLTTNLLGCNFGSTHPVLWHYNQMDKVFIGTVIKIGNPKTMEFAYREKDTNIPTYKIKFVVNESYRGAMPDTIDIGKLALAKINFREGDTYLVYANYMKADDLLVTGSVLHVLDDRMSRHSILKEVVKNPNGLITEYNSVTGEKWAEGVLKNGEPVGEWNYYEITGEPKEKGKYKNGKRHGKWHSYFVTDARYYNFFQAVRIGRAGQFKLISHKEITDPKNLYVYEMVYKDLSKGDDEILVHYLYKNPIKERVTKFKNGMLHGKEKIYNDHGELVAFQTFKNHTLDGKSKLIQTQYDKDNNEYQTVFESIYKNGRVYSEIIYYFENGKLDGKEQTITPE